MTDPFHLNRFVIAQEPVFNQARAELKLGRKASHWMWFIFPQVDGLGSSETTKLYAIKSLAEANAYLDHPLLGPRLIECADVIFDVEGKTALEIFGSPDNRKLQSSMTLFNYSRPGKVFALVLEKYFNGENDDRSLEIIKSLAS